LKLGDGWITLHKYHDKQKNRDWETLHEYQNKNYQKSRQKVSQLDCINYRDPANENNLHTYNDLNRVFQWKNEAVEFIKSFNKEKDFSLVDWNRKKYRLQVFAQNLFYLPLNYGTHI
jgi:hypothetical protein